jgi:serine/threonine-protein kinase
MSQPAADRSLLFGLLAFQNNFIDRDALLAAFNSWVADKARPLDRVLLDRGALTPARHALLAGLVEEHLRLHGDDPRRSLAALSSIGSAHRDLEAVADDDLRASLVHVSVARRPGDEATPTQDFTAGESTSTGGRFRVLRFHARGGLGQVSVALDRELGREVALKEIQDRYADHHESRARFRLEAEVTGGLEHPGIVPVYGLGHDPAGRPFYAMRFVKGDNLREAIKQFHAADSPGRDPGERSLAFRKLLGRFIDVCNAVAYAHSKGVLHRDLKPGNVMLGPYGETLVVDWGLAKLIDGPAEAAGEERPLRPSAASETGETVAGSRVGTPGFMSPEQAEGRLDELGPASDVYSLGATLYPLLTGRPAFQGRDEGEVLAKALRGEIAPPRQVKPSVPPALESICLKAMARRPAGRYATPRELAGDIEHWLADEPVSAHREGRAARLARWARRHRTWVQTGVAALAVGLVATAVLAAQQSRAADRERKARLLAESRLKQVEAGSDLLASIFRDLNPRVEEKEGKPLGAILGERIGRAAEQLEGQSVSDPLTVAKLQDALAVSLTNLYHTDRAIALLTKARRTREGRLGPDHPQTLTSRSNLASAYLAAGRTAEAIALYQETLSRLEAKLGPDHSVTLSVRNNLGSAYIAAGRTAEAIALHEGALRLREAKLGPGHPDTLTSRSNLAAAYWAAGRTAEAIALEQGTLKLREAKLGPGHPDTLSSRNNLAAAYQSAGRTAEAIALHEGTLRLREAKLGPDHPQTLTSRSNLAAAYQDAGRTAESIPLFEAALKLHEAKLGPDHPRTHTIRDNLALAYEQLGRWAEAEALHRALLAHRRRSDPPDSPALAGDLARLGSVLLHQAKWSEAEAALRECLAIRTKARPDNWTRFNTMSMLGGALLGQGRYAEAEPFVVAGYEGLKAREARIPGPSRPRLDEAAERVILLYEAWGKPEQAAAWRANLGRPDLPSDVFARP